MKIGLISRHCDSCKKDVFDFTQKSREEIIIHLLSNPNENVCGRMRGDQFDFHHDDIPILIDALKHRPSNSSFLILTLVCLSLVACGSDNTSIKPKKEDVVKVRIEPDTTQITTGNYTMSNHKSQTIAPKTPEKINRKKINKEPQEIITGEYIVPHETEPPSSVKGMILCEPPKELSDTILKFAEKMPEYSGGLSALYKFIEVNTKYPAKERNEGIQGTVYAKIIIKKDGSVSNPSIVKSIIGHPNFDEEVLRVIKLMPNWIPGENIGQKVDVEYTLPFRFKIPD